MALISDSQAADWLKPPVEQRGLRRYIDAIRERQLLVVLIVVVCTLGSVLYVLAADKVYEAEADLLVTPVPAEQTVVSSLGLIRESADPALDVETAAQLIDSTDAAERAAKELGDGTTTQEVLDAVRIEPVPESNIVAVIAEDSDPERARDLANAYAGAAVDERTAELRERIEAALPRLQAQLARVSPDEVSADSLAAQIVQLQTLAAGPDPTIQLETEATTPSSPVSPKPALTIGAGVVGGLVLGLLVAFAWKALDPRLRREDQLRGIYSLPILARIPREPRARSGRPLLPETLSPSAREAYRTLRTTLGASASSPEGPRSILVMGASPSEGKTTTAINLAVSLAIAGFRTILIEADLRRPALRQAFGRRVENGVVSVLMGEASLEDALVTTANYGPNLELLLADRSGPGTADLLSLPAAQRLIDDAEKLADYVIVDSPPLTAVIDALPLARRVDQVLLVARLGTSRLHAVKELGELLASNGVKPVGFALLSVPRGSTTAYYYGSGETDSEASQPVYVEAAEAEVVEGATPRE